MKRDMRPTFYEGVKFASSFEQLRASLPARVSIVVQDRVQLRLGRFAALVAGMLRFEMSVFEQMDEATAWLQRRKVMQMNDVKAKISEIWSGLQLAALATVDEQGRPCVRYVMTRADEQLTVRFATYRETNKVRQILANPEVHLVAGVASLASAHSWVQISGRATITEAEEDRRLAWNDGLKVFFDGPDDPGYVIGVVRPYRIEYMEMGYTQPEVWRP